MPSVAADSTGSTSEHRPSRSRAEPQVQQLRERQVLVLPLAPALVPCLVVSSVTAVAYATAYLRDLVLVPVVLVVVLVVVLLRRQAVVVLDLFRLRGHR